MKKLAILFVVGIAWGQQQRIQLVAPPPTGVSTVNATRVGNAGSAFYRYWVVAKFPIGNAIVSPAAIVRNAPDTLSGSNYVSVSWNPVAGATGYDVLRTITATITVPCTCGISLNTSSVTYNDQSNSASSYTMTTASGATANISLDNIDYANPRIVIDTALNLPYIGAFTVAALPSTGLAFNAVAVTTDGSTSTNACTVGGGSTYSFCLWNGSAWQTVGGGSTTTPGGTNGQIEYNNAGAFGGFTASGDATVNTGTGAVTLATVNSGSGICGDATHVCQITTNGKGLVTVQAAVSITQPTLRTWSYTYAGNAQSAVAGFNFNIPTSSGPSILVEPAGGTNPIGVLQYPTGQSTYQGWVTLLLPAGYVSNANITYSVESECDTATTCDSTHAGRLFFGLACSSSVVSNPTYTDMTVISITNAATGAPTTTTGNIVPNAGGLPTCAAGQRTWIRVKVDTNTNSMTGPFNVSSLTFTVQGSM